MRIGLAPLTLRERAVFGVRSIAPLAVGVAIAFTLYFTVAANTFLERLLILCGLAVIMAASLNIVNGYTGQFSLGHAAFMAIGGYVSGAVSYYGSLVLWKSNEVHGGLFGPGDWLFFVAVVAGGLAAALAGLLVGLPSLRLRGDYLAIVTLGFGEIVRVLLTLSRDVLRTPEAVAEAGLPRAMVGLGGALGFNGIPKYTNLLWLYVWVTITLIICYRLKESIHGRAFLSVRENEIAAEAMGVPSTQFKVKAFVAAAFLGGIGGGLFAHDPAVLLNANELGFMKSLDFVIMVVLGGMGSITGCVLAAVALTLTPEVLREFAQYRMVIYALLLILVMILRPNGLMGIHELWDLKIVRRFAGRFRKPTAA
ncbi:branched-chain amino acid ABC transporter permease [Candidatus Poribacteria bacterium]|nr:branched-chain amino acid ABC transporter permease [Candidatus Poribacteria bacterium]